PWGGARAGAGRPKGSPSLRAAAAVAAADRISPVEVMRQAMEAHLAAGNLDKAAAVARDLAPYVHARLSAVQHTHTEGAALEVVEEMISVPSPAAAPEAPPPDGAAPSGAA